MQEDLPDFPQEMEFMKLLNRIKNKMLDNYDKVYPENNIPPEYDRENYIVQSIRNLFFSKFLPFIKPAYLAINTVKPFPKNMHEYWSSTEYIEYITDNTDPNQVNEYVYFARRLLVSRSFVHFMDGYIEDQVVNFDLVNSILCFRGDLRKRYKVPSLTLRDFDKPMKTRIDKCKHT
mmetsp:Transcript_30244/g.46246  ORF Transcript_30244/g.46246 Transcript_30244/m.46246 type:complete len:176 (-) Transcript_30244:5273-5800(-)